MGERKKNVNIGNHAEVFELCKYQGDGKSIEFITKKVEKIKS